MNRPNEKKVMRTQKTQPKSMFLYVCFIIICYFFTNLLKDQMTDPCVEKDVKMLTKKLLTSDNSVVLSVFSSYLFTYPPFCNMEDTVYGVMSLALSLSKNIPKFQFPKEKMKIIF